MKNLALGILFILGAVLTSCNGSGDSTTKTDMKDTTVTSTTPTQRDSSTGSTGKDTSLANNNQGGATPGSNNNVSSGPVDDQTKAFAKKAASGGMMEVELGKLAQQNAKSQRVKDFGSMMNTDHTNANNELKSLALMKHMDLPADLDPKDRKHVGMMSKMKGAAFDKMYMDMMVNDHKTDVAEFKKASENLKDADIKNFAGKTLPTLQKHLDSANAIHGKK